jgi:putative transposase
MEQVCVDLKIQATFSEVGQPRGRGRIERFMRTVDQLFLCEQPGYAPSDSPPVQPSLTLAEFDVRFKKFLLENYHQRVHSETGIAPQVRWEAGGFLPRVAESLEQLDLLLLTIARPRRVHQDGIHFQSLRYLDVTLAAYVGEEVMLRYDPRDMAEIRVYYRDTFICRAVCQEIAGQTISLKDIIRARTKRRQELHDKIKDRQAIVETLMEIGRSQPPPPPEPKSPVGEGPAVKPLKRYRNE